MSQAKDIFPQTWSLSKLWWSQSNGTSLAFVDHKKPEHRAGVFLSSRDLEQFKYIIDIDGDGCSGVRGTLRFLTRPFVLLTNLNFKLAYYLNPV